MAEMTTLGTHPRVPPVAPSIPVASTPRYEVAPLPVRRFSVAEYHRLIEQGFFAADERFELLEGWIAAKVSRNPVHDAAVDVGEQLFAGLLPAGWYVRGQKAFTTGDSEPEPDIVIVRGVPRDYALRHPGPADAAVVIEVANSSLAEDREVKLRVYARAGVAVYWIVNLIDRTVEVHTQPSIVDGVPTYVRREVFGATQSVGLTVGGSTVGPIGVVDLLP
jgi:Uma2 family endonuclease